VFTPAPGQTLDRYRGDEITPIQGMTRGCSPLVFRGAGLDAL
jgi:hypothetical protein